MEMDASGFVSEFVVKVDNDRITYIHFDCWTRELVIDSDDRTVILAIWIRPNPSGVPVVGDGFGDGKSNEGG